jgi:hypothetical protein
VRYSDVQGGYSGTGNISLDPRLGPFGNNNGGPTLTIALEPGSPAIDAGNNAFIPAGVTTDQRGFPRVSGAAVDLGAYEVQLPTVLPDGAYGTAYSQALTATEGPGGVGVPYTFAVAAGSLPAGLSLTPGGALTGTPSAPGQFSFTVTDSDRSGFMGRRSYTLTIDPAAPAVSVTDAGGTYNGQPYAGSATAVGRDGTAAVAGSFHYAYYAGAGTSGPSLGGMAPSSAGTYTVVATFTSADPNYASGTAQATFTIAKAPLTVTADDVTIIQGETPTITVRYSGFVNGEGPRVLGGALTFVITTPSTLAPGTYALTPSGLTSGNYAIAFVSGTLTVLSYGQATNTLKSRVDAAGLDLGTQHVLDTQLQKAIAYFSTSNTAGAVSQLTAFVDLLSAPHHKNIGIDLADAWVAYAQRIITATG